MPRWATSCACSWAASSVAAENHEIVCTFDDAVIEQIVSRCTEVESGGRMVDAILTNTLLPQISHTLLTGSANDQRYRQLHIALQNHNSFVNFRHNAAAAETAAL